LLRTLFARASPAAAATVISGLPKHPMINRFR
jgi:hypothetical protein